MAAPIDYYSILELKRSCTDLEINSAYRKWALKYHPQRNSTGRDRDVAEKQFKLVSEAYQVLKDPQRRAIFDQYGEKGLKEGVKTTDGGVIPGWQMNLDPCSMFEECFGSASPFAGHFSQDSSSILFTHATHPKPKQKLPPQEVNLYCSLEELYMGCTKKQKIYRDSIISSSSSSTSDNNNNYNNNNKRNESEEEHKTEMEEKILTIDIGAGWKNNTKITFAHEGNERYDHETADVVFVLKEKPHPRFTRQGNHLIFRHTITLLQALTGTTVDVITLDNRHLPIAVVGLESNTATVVVKGEGMPNPRNTAEKGDLILEFQVLYPTNLSLNQKNALKGILKE